MTIDKVKLRHSANTAEFAARFAGLIGSALTLPASSVETAAVVETDDDEQDILVTLDANPPEDARVAALIEVRRVSRSSVRGNVACFAGTAAGDLEDLCGRIAGLLRRTAPIPIASHRAAVTELARLAYAVTPRGRLRRTFGRPRAKQLAIVLGMAAVGASAIAAYDAAWRVPPARERIDFERGVDGWTVESAPDSRGCTSLEQARGTSKGGTGSLQIHVALDGQSHDRRSGEAWLDLRSTHAFPQGAADDLGERTLVASVLARADHGSTEPARVGFQLFVKDSSFRGCYGAVEPARGDWVKVSVNARCDAPGQYFDAGYDGHALATLGVKVALPDDASGKFVGSVFVDSLGW
ncbi:MAG TPA: hypothetical protein VGQ57_04050 [Polyangiaceae bacterium]|nr:hypothetical protein [Polyangiaceae bacterium]